MATPFSVFDPAQNTLAGLTNALLAGSSGITIAPGSITLKASGQEAVNFYDGSLAPLGIGAGLLLTSGTTPGTSNTVGWFGQDNSGTSGFYNGDASIDAVVNTVFQTQSYDATTLSFDFTVADPAATSVSFDVVFGSDEFPEWVDQFVDSAIVKVNGVNYALFNHDPAHPLSVVSANLAAGYFQDNAGNSFPIEYDGVSHVLKLVAPIATGAAVNHIEIGIADTGDHIYDSGIFLANFSAGNIPGSGVVITPPVSGTDNSDTLTGSSKDEYFDLKDGDDSCYSGGGDDILVGGSGNDALYAGSGADQLKGDSGDDFLDGGDDADTAVFSGASTDYVVTAAGAGFTVTDQNAGPAAEGTDTLANVEYAKFSDGLFAIGPGGVLTPVPGAGTPPSNAAGSVMISGIGSAGKTLTATVSDADGIAGPVSYQWQVSGDNGATWNDVGADSSSYAVSAGDVGMDVQVIASYIDAGAQAESPVSASKTILASGEGDLVVTLMQLDAPTGAGVINPLTTLVQDAIDLGISPNVAALGIKAVLGLPDGINLQTYDAYAVLQANPADATALAVERVAVEVAVLTSLSDDDTGVNLTLKILDAAANSQTLNLADANDLADILGIDISGIENKKDYPEPLREILDRNENIAEANDVSGIETEWQDLLSLQDGIASTSIADLSIHVNQAPTGSATASLGAGLEGTPYLVGMGDLLQGFGDADGDPLSVLALSADNGIVTDNLDGTFTITAAADYSGPVELTYLVSDGQGGSAPASQLFVIAPGGNQAPTGAATGVLAAGSEDVAYIVSAPDLLAGFSDADGDVLSVSSVAASNGVVADNGDGTFTVTPTADYHGPVTLSYDVIDGNGGSIGGTLEYVLSAQNDAPTGEVTITGTAVQGAVLEAANTLADVDGLGTIAYQWAADGLDIGGATGSNYALTQADVGKLISVTASYTDLTGTAESVASLATAAVANVDDEATGALSVAGAAAEGGSLVASLAGVLDIDGSTTTAYQWQEDIGGTWTAIGGQTGASLVIPSDQSYVGKTVRVVATTTDSLGGSTEFAGIAQVIANVNDAPTGLVTISGLATTGQVLSASNTLADEDGPGTIAYQWAADGVDISGASGSSYALTQAEAGKAITVTASYTDLSGTSESVISAATAAVGSAGVIRTGTAGSDLLIGSAGDDILRGLGGHDTLIGLGGNDRMIGGSGNDVYHVDSSGDVVTEAAGAGSDLVVASIDYTLGDHVENLKLAGDGAIDGSGNSLANILTGNQGNNTLAGGGGSDILIGNDGNDALNGGTGIDLLLGGAGSDLLEGGAGNDTLEGGAGNDVLAGGDGNDYLVGGAGADVFRFDTALKAGRDTIVGFRAVDDSIQLEDAIFDQLPAGGALPSEYFRANAGGHAVDANDYILYDTQSGRLYYDTDGSGAVGAILFATLTGAPPVTGADFIVV